MSANSVSVSLDRKERIIKRQSITRHGIVKGPMTANITRIRNSKEMTKTFKHKKTELTESFLKGSVSSVISCEEVTSGEGRVWNEEGREN
jgi:hypothetical protein